MRDFQRRYEFDTGVQALFATERVSLLRWTVPPNEFWRPLNLSVSQTDSIQHQVLTTFTMARNPAVIRYVPTRTKIQAGAAKIVYGADADGSMASGSSAQVDEWISRIPVIMEPGDLFSFIDETAAAGALTLTWVFVYERVPQPAVARNPGVVGAVTVV